MFTFTKTKDPTNEYERYDITFQNVSDNATVYEVLDCVKTFLHACGFQFDELAVHYKDGTVKYVEEEVTQI
jgi:hypothetical protein